MLPMSEPKNKNNWIVDPQNILEEILSNLVSVKTRLKMYHSEFQTHDTESMTGIELQKGTFNKIHYLCVLFFMIDKMGNVSFSCDGYIATLCWADESMHNYNSLTLLEIFRTTR
jgi:hypothetical protein